jgi:hypothetical protein
MRSDFLEEDVMIVHALYRDHISYAVEREVSRQVAGDRSGGLPDHDFDETAAEICRMIELSGMIGLDCNLLPAD